MSAESLLDAVDARAAAATPGPWVQSGWDPKIILSADWAEDTKPIEQRAPFTSFHASDDGDAAFIAAARTDLPRLSAALRAVLDHLDGLIGSTARNGHQPTGWTTDYFEGYVRARQEINEGLRGIRVEARSERVGAALDAAAPVRASALGDR